MLLDIYCDFELCMVHVGRLDYIWFRMIHKRGADNKRMEKNADSDNMTGKGRLVCLLSVVDARQRQPHLSM